jgi:hypothetical protein
MAQNAGDCAQIKNQSKTASDQTPTTGFHAELHSMEPSQLAPQKAGAQAAECSSLPKLDIHDSKASAASEGEKPADSSQHAASAKPDQHVDTGKSNGDVQTNPNSARPTSDKGGAISSAYEALDLDVSQQRPNSDALNADRQANPNSLRPDGTAPIPSTYEGLDLDVRNYNPNNIAPDENQNQNALMERIKTISAAQSRASAPTAASHSN